MSTDQIEDEDFDVMDLFRSRMTVEQQQGIDVIDRLNAVFVESGRDTIVRAKFDRFLAFVLADQRYGRRGKGNAFYVTGESGAGKTDLVERLLNEHPVMKPFEYAGRMLTPWVRVSLQGPATLAVLGREILGQVQYRVKPTMRENVIWELLPKELKKAKVKFVHIDETQHLLKKRSRGDVEAAIKGLMNDPEWPISFILSGKPELNEMVLHDDQVERRQYSMALPALHPEEDRSIIESIIRELAGAATLDVENLLASDVPERIAHGANYQFGRMCEITICAIHIAALAEQFDLTRENFAKAYRDRSNTHGLDDMNPFEADDWTILRPGFFVAPEVEE